MHEPLTGAQRVHDRLEVALRRARAQALDAVAPVGHADVLHVAGQRRVAQAGREVVVQHRHLLGLGGDDDVAGRQARPDRVGDRADVALGRRPHVVAPQERDDDQAEDAEPARVGEPGGDEQQERRDGDREVAHRPRGRELRGRSRRAARCRPRSRRRASTARPCAVSCRPRPAWTSAATPPPAATTSTSHARVAEQPVRRLHRDLLVVGLARPRRAGVGGLEEQRRHPGQEQQRGDAEAEQRRRSAAPGARRPGARNSSAEPRRRTSPAPRKSAQLWV